MSTLDDQADVGRSASIELSRRDWLRDVAIAAAGVTAVTVVATPAAAAEPAQATAMTRTIRVLWGRTRSGWKNFNWRGVIDQNSVVHISASEGFVDTGSIFGPLHAIRRIRGAATIYVKNVRPHPDQGGGGGVEFFLQVDWNSPLDVVTDITVVAPPEQGIIV